MTNRSVLVFPDDTSKPILDAISNAKKSIRIKMFVFSDPDLIQAVIAAKKKELDVRVMLNPARRNGEEENGETRKLLEEAGIEVKDSNPDFGLTHEKSMTVDDEVTEAIEGFEADWNRQKFEPGEKALLIWCRGNGRERIARFIDNARHSLFLQNERYQDPVIIERLVRAAARGVKIHLMAKPPHSLKKEKIIEGVGGLRILDDVGIKIRKLKHLKLHGKILVADGARAIVGSINLAPGSFDDRRELAIEVNDEEIIDRLHEILKFDWENGHPMDLSDEGLFADLKSHGESDDVLVLNVDKKKEKDEDD